MSIIQDLITLFNIAPAYFTILIVLIVVGMPLYIWGMIEQQRAYRHMHEALDRLPGLFR